MGVYFYNKNQTSLQQETENAEKYQIDTEIVSTINISSYIVKKSLFAGITQITFAKHYSY